MNKAVFLDRDGVIIRALVKEGKPHPPASLAETEILPGVHEALQQLKDAGYLLIVITNQPDVARGIQTREEVEAIHDYLHQNLPLDAIFTCYHDNADGCLCRKPEPGLILKARTEFNIELAVSFLVGDRWKDIEAGYRAGCSTILIDYRYDEPQPTTPSYTVHSLVEAAALILKRR